MVNSTAIDKQQIWDYLAEIPDPEIPVINVIELGVVRDVEIENDNITVVITPTYSGCPAMKMIEEDVVKHLKKKGLKNVTVKSVLSPAWTTDWITEEAKEKLRKYGIAPPDHAVDKASLLGKEKFPTCPRCSSNNTKMISQFGSTPCKALYSCKDCLEPFDYFKCI